MHRSNKLFDEAFEGSYGTSPRPKLRNSIKILLDSIGSKISLDSTRGKRIKVLRFSGMMTQRRKMEDSVWSSRRHYLGGPAKLERTRPGIDGTPVGCSLLKDMI